LRCKMSRKREERAPGRKLGGESVHKSWGGKKRGGYPRLAQGHTEKGGERKWGQENKKPRM